jgi:membrane fusion protein (multidrug efflux system)
MVPPPETVTAVPVKADTWEDTLTATGTIVTVQGVTVSAEVPGKIASINFESGASIQAGDMLVQLDTSIEEAQLRAAEANAGWAKVNLERSTDLVAKNAVSKSDYDLVDAQSKQAIAQADNIRAVIAKKTIRAPFSGRLGIRLVNLGQILKEGDAIASLQTLDPIYANFSLPQQQLAAVAAGTVVRVTTDAAPGRVIEGKINAINPDIDPATRSVRIQATFPNHDELLRPGMFASVKVVQPKSENVLVIPATAVLYAPYGDSVFVIDDKKNVRTGAMEKILRQQFIRIAASRGDFVAIASGLKADDTIVTSGVFKLRPGESVIIDNKLAPDAQLAPKPDNT